MWPVTGHISYLFLLTLLSLLFQAQQKKAVINIFQHYSICLFIFFETRVDRVTLVPLRATGFDGLMIVDQVVAFDRLAVYSGVTHSDNLVMVGILS